MSEQPLSQPDQTLSEALLPRSALLPLLPVNTPPGSDVAPTLAPTDGVGTVMPRERLGRFEVYGEIGRGGMGAVLRGRDLALGRDLAIKVLLTGRQGNADALQRFQEEAQIGGQLQHPGLVPVYELGTASDGRPFFAMKLVDGRTLATMLKSRRSLTDDWPRFLTIFEQVCQALGYAHARGVIHRDLKPANIMIGAFGEVQVMDWGLAKVLGSNGPDGRAGNKALSGETTVHTTRTESEGSESRAGSVLGTPGYMPPEQARGEIDRLDRRVDVFGLGAILCEILTGQPPFTGGTVGEILGRSGGGDLTEAFARLDGSGADAELVGLAKLCLAAEPAARPHDGAAVAEQVAAYRAGVAERLRGAELARAGAEVRASEERRRRRVQLALAGALLLLMTLGVGGGWYVRSQQLERQQKQEREHQAVERAVEQDLAEVAERQGQRRWTEAWATLERAEGRLGPSRPTALRERLDHARRNLEQIRTDHDMATRLEEARLQVAGIRGHETANAAFRDAFTWYGLDLESLPLENTADRIRASTIREELVAGLYQWAVAIGERRRPDAERLIRIAVLADADPWRRRLAEAASGQDQAALLVLARQADPTTLSPASAMLLAVCYEIAGQTENATPVLRAVQRRHPDDFLLNVALGQHYQYVVKPVRPEEAVRFYTAASALRPRNAGVFFELGNALKKQFRGQEALLAYREACRLQPENVALRNVLAYALLVRGEWSEAETVCRAAIHQEPANAEAHNNLGIALRDQGRLREAEAACREAVRLQPEGARPHCSLGFVLRKQGQLEASRESFRRGQELAVKTPGTRLPAAQWLREAERLVELDQRWPDIRDGKTKPAHAAEQLEFAQVASLKQRYAVAVRLSNDAFQADGSLANELVKDHRFAASRYAILAAVDGERTLKPVNEPECVRLRTLALDWLREDLSAWSRRLDSGKPEDRDLVAYGLGQWQTDADLASVRDTIDQLPEAERASWRNLWEEVAALRLRTEPK